MEKQLNQAMTLRENGELNKSNRLLVELVEIYPFYASINYECAQSFRLVGKESEAVPYFEQALRLGLPSESLADTYLFLSHGYQVMGDQERAREALQKGNQLKQQQNKLEQHQRADDANKVTE
ncbi:tetratricopeptide repeat protein [Allobacillus sp. GCM10007491]|uniref:Tetratricopeptide repeat protein n=1 Tax=Allobacillus saliphilus TaxID=2912308 RepID=A0A941HU15_9BACI|nr:tetratricopeptide repeat protein [Allobacillus saliphilus]MBR7554948.1 tetratricopeptide repeat protein [Allobacillus saliphilus]